MSATKKETKSVTILLLLLSLKDGQSSSCKNDAMKEEPPIKLHRTDQLISGPIKIVPFLGV